MIRFTKMHGIGNDFVIVNGLEERLDPETLPALAREMSDRRFGVGSDGLIVLDRGPESVLRMRMWNPDGSESEMCGNGVRCFARYAQDRGLADQPRIPVETGAGRLVLEVLADLRVQVDMGIARLTAAEIGMPGEGESKMIDEPVKMPDGSWLPGTAVSMGNPHLVLFVDDVDAIPLESWGPVLEHEDRFPKRVNVHFAPTKSHRHSHECLILSLRCPLGRSLWSTLLSSLWTHRASNCTRLSIILWGCILSRLWSLLLLQITLVHGRWRTSFHTVINHVLHG